MVKVGISLGDLNGVGSELVLKSFEDYDMLDFCTPVIFANKRLMSFLKKQFNLKLHFHGVHSASAILEKKINVVNVWKERVEVNFGVAEEELSIYSKKSIEAAVKALQEGDIDVLVNAPRGDYLQESKETLVEGLLPGSMLRMRVNDDFIIGNFQSRPLNPEKDLDTALFRKEIGRLQKCLLEDFRISRPRIAVLTPCWKADTDSQAIGKAVEELQKEVRANHDKDMIIYGLYDRKQFFETERCHQFDALIDFEAAEAEACFGGWPLPHVVNYFAGLKAVVVNSNRGVDYALAGKGKEDAAEFRQALYTGIDIYRRREEYKLYAANPLQKYKLKRKK